MPSAEAEMPKPGEVPGILSSVELLVQRLGLRRAVDHRSRRRPSAFWRSYASTACGTLYSLSISSALIL